MQLKQQQKTILSGSLNVRHTLIMEDIKKLQPAKLRTMNKIIIAIRFW